MQTDQPVSSKEDAFVAFRDGETTHADWIALHETHVTYGVGNVVRSVPWDLVEFTERHLEESLDG